MAVGKAAFARCTSRRVASRDRTNRDTQAVVPQRPHKVELDPVERDTSEVKGHRNISEIIPDEHDRCSLDGNICPAANRDPCAGGRHKPQDATTVRNSGLRTKCIATWGELASCAPKFA
eukprot:COSAG02_NODE_10325_length_1967_cov_32.788009_1_plen_119_part_00